jgi:hypothetical protein
LLFHTVLSSRSPLYLPLFSRTFAYIEDIISQAQTSTHARLTPHKINRSHTSALVLFCCLSCRELGIQLSSLYTELPACPVCFKWKWQCLFIFTPLIETKKLPCLISPSKNSEQKISCLISPSKNSESYQLEGRISRHRHLSDRSFLVIF